MIKIAIVEDNIDYRAILVRILRHSDSLLVNWVYSSAEEAMPDLLIHQPDVAIIDIELPLMSGIALIKKIFYLMPRTQFLICTSHQDNDHIFDALRAGASGYILKDTPAEDIRNAIKELFMGGSPMSRNVARKIIAIFRQTATGRDNHGLSEREIEVLKLMTRGLLYKEIAEKLAISSNTVKGHLKSIYKKLHVQNKIEAINKYQS